MNCHRVYLLPRILPNTHLPYISKHQKQTLDKKIMIFLHCDVFVTMVYFYSIFLYSYNKKSSGLDKDLRIF